MKSIGVSLVVAFLLSGCGRFLASYDLSIETRVPGGIYANAYFGKHQFLAGAFSGGRAVNVGSSAPITDTALLKWGSGLDQRQREKLLRVNTPWRWPNEKYHFLFTVFPGDSATMEIQVLKRNDCSHLDPKYAAAVAYDGSSPCSW